MSASYMKLSATRSRQLNFLFTYPAVLDYGYNVVVTVQMNVVDYKASRPTSSA